MKTTMIRPLGDRVLIEAAKTEEKVGRILIPENAREKTQEGVVVCLGTGKVDRSLEGKKKPFPFKVNDRVLISKYGGTEITLGGRDLRIVSVDDVIALLG